jgi:putative glycosyltransferase
MSSPSEPTTPDFTSSDPGDAPPARRAPRLSIVTAMYKSTSFVRRFHAEISAVAATFTSDFEIIFVDDRSPDDSAAIVEALIAEDPRVRLIKLSRNYGQSTAMLAGMQAARGQLIYTSDIDLEDPPELLGQFHQMMIEAPELQSVYGFMNARKGTFLERWLGHLFYRLLNFLTRESIPSQVWSRLMTRKYLDAVLSYSETHLFWSGIFHTVGFSQRAVAVERQKTGKTSYNYLKKLELALSAITSFSSGPLFLVFFLGVAVSGASLIGALFLILQHATGALVPGWASIVVAILFIGGVTNVSLGVIGLYIGRIFVQTKNRPRFFIEKEL